MSGATGLFGGVLAALAVPPFGYWPLAIAGTALLYAAVRSASPRRRLLAGFAFGLGFFGIGYAWVANLVAGGWIALTVFEAGLTALACLAIRGAGPSLRSWRPTGFATTMVLADAFRWWWPFGGMPIGSVALGQAAAPLGQLGRVGGPLLVEGATFVLGACLGELLAGTRERPLRFPTGVLVILTTTAGLIALSYGAPDGGTPAGHLRVALVQGGGVRGLHALFTDASIVYQRQLKPTLSLPDRPRPDLVVWPEDVIALDRPLAGSPEAGQVGDAARRLHTTLVAGVTETVGSMAFRNEAVAWAPDGSIIATYEKVHRVPFGEYIPFRSFFSHFGPTGLVPRDAIPGHRPGILVTPAGQLGVMISFEVFYPGPAAAAVSRGATVLVVPTNDASYSTGQVPAQEVAADRLRAIEEGRNLVQAAPTGYTDVVDNRGRLIGRTSLGTAAVLERSVALHTGRTWYSVLGDWPMIGLALGLLIAYWSLTLSRPSCPRPMEVPEHADPDNARPEEARLP